ncbi:MAG: hypothetical protein BWY51_00426 [Parcubacteria group bacterium ADurb.Bin316]|nr:MAG: hypothetical protein BWY51_00426 [Parcubacteria group bacterium ADurb.Bin316]HOZ55860.1 hypothetical protein [bacterium]
MEENNIVANNDNNDRLEDSKKRSQKKTVVRNKAKKKTVVGKKAVKSSIKKTTVKTINPIVVTSVLNKPIASQPMALPPGDEGEIDLGKPLYFNAAREELKKELDKETDSLVDKKETDSVANVKVTAGKEDKKYFDARPAVLDQPVKKEEYIPKTMKTIVNETKGDSSRLIKQKHSLKLYRNIALLFIAATIILFIAIGYFVFVRIKITLIPNQENISNNMIFDIADKEVDNSASSNSTIVGLVKKINIKLDKNYQATGENIVGKEAVGEAAIVNNYEKNQPLVATTRLLTPDGKLFRIKETVNVPAGGSVKVAIYADQPSEEMAIGPTKFTIPGLWAGLQEKIYAQTDQAIVYQQKVEKYIVSEDIENGKNNAKQAILEKAKETVDNDYKEYEKVIYSLDEPSISNQIEAKVGDKADEFTVKMSADVFILAFDEEKIKSLARGKFILSLADNKELVSFNDGGIVYSINSSNVDKGLATINATFEGKVTLKDGSSVVDVTKILGLNKDQLDAYLSSIPDLAGYEVKFTPSWLWKVPQFIEPSKIQVEIKK